MNILILHNVFKLIYVKLLYGSTIIFYMNNNITNIDRSTVLMHTNSSIYILICLCLILNSMFCCVAMLECIYSLCLVIYFSQVSVGCLCPCSTYHRWRISNPFHYIVVVQVSLHVCISICVKLTWKKQSKLGNVYCFYR
jgi:hypothetical protein